MHFSRATTVVVLALAWLSAATPDRQPDVDVASPPQLAYAKPKGAALHAPHHDYNGGGHRLLSPPHSRIHRLAHHNALLRERRFQGAAAAAAAQRDAERKKLLDRLHQLNRPTPPPTTYRATDSRNRNLFGRAIPHRGVSKHQRQAQRRPSPKQRTGKAYKVDMGGLSAAVQRDHALESQINAAKMEQKSLRAPYGASVPGGKLSNGNKLIGQYQQQESRLGSVTAKMFG